MSELDLTNIATASIATPASGVLAVFGESTNKLLSVKDDTGYVRSLGGNTNFSTASQTFTALTRTYVFGSSIKVPSGKLQIGTCFQWVFDLTKTAAGTGTSIIDIAVGTAGTTADVARVSFSKPAGTAAIDTGFITIAATCRGPLSASGIFVGNFQMTHNGNTVGHATIPCVNVTTVSGTFDVTIPNLIVGVCLTSGTSDVVTIQQVIAQAWNM